MIFQNNLNFFEKKIVCFKGGGDGYDKAYNARMATIAETQSEWATKYNEFWETYEKPYEIASAEANLRMLPGQEALATRETELGTAQAESAIRQLPGQEEFAMAQTGLGTEQAASALRLLPSQEELAMEQTALGTEQAASERGMIPLRGELEKGTILDKMTAMQQRAPVREKFYKESMEGVDAKDWMQEAQAEAAKQFMGAEGQTKRGKE